MVQKTAASEKLQEKLLPILQDLGSNAPAAWIQAMNSFLVAMEYEDRALMQSHKVAALESFRTVIEEDIQDELEWLDKTTKALGDIRQLLRGYPREDLEGLGKQLEWGLGRRLKEMVSTRDESVKFLREREFEVANSDRLNDAIEVLQQLQATLVENWPWSAKELPPVDRNMVAESRAAFARQEGERIEDLIRRLGGNTEQL